MQFTRLTILTFTMLFCTGCNNKEREEEQRQLRINGITFMENGKYEEYDYEFGTYTREDSFRDLFWNNVYSVKSYIPRFQKRKIATRHDFRVAIIF